MAARMAARRKRKPFKACRNCQALVPRDAQRCPYCGSTDLAEEWEGVVIILDASKTPVSKELGVDKPGRYALRVY